MVNPNARLTVIEHSITLNWDDGPTLHKLIAQVRYHRAGSVIARTMRVLAAHYTGEPAFDFQRMEDNLEVHWQWRALGEGWCAQLGVRNTGEEDVFVDSLEVLCVEHAMGGQFNLGAPPGLWQCAHEGSTAEELTWEMWAPGTSTGEGFVRRAELLIYPLVSNRTRPPALLIRALPSAQPLPTELRVNMGGERFDRLIARCKTDGLPLMPSEAVRSPWFWLVSGDDPAELLRLALPAPETA
ncbi:MAG: hypothetical protein NZL91_09850 [Thermoflexales bacterium]|nr:hypothetical protein [Thermoflexales bacterium]MDW8053255.1 hypothetical protein [Anaerolineae bacterium]MDW8291906.1 hypothetical protein [Anaerolineae bacterium]